MTRKNLISGKRNTSTALYGKGDRKSSRYSDKKYCDQLFSHANRAQKIMPQGWIVVLMNCTHRCLRPLSLFINSVINEQSRLLIAVPYHPISFWLSDKQTRVAYEHYQEFSWDMRVTTKSTWYIGGLQTMREAEHFRYLNMCREFRNLGLYSSNSWLQLQLKFSLKILKAFYWSHNAFWADQHNLPWYYRDLTEVFEEKLQLLKA